MSQAKKQSNKVKKKPLSAPNRGVGAGLRCGKRRRLRRRIAVSSCPWFPPSHSGLSWRSSRAGRRRTRGAVAVEEDERLPSFHGRPLAAGQTLRQALDLRTVPTRPAASSAYACVPLQMSFFATKRRHMKRAPAHRTSSRSVGADVRRSRRAYQEIHAASDERARAGLGRGGGDLAAAQRVPGCWCRRQREPEHGLDRFDGTLRAAPASTSRKVLSRQGARRHLEQGRMDRAARRGLTGGKSHLAAGPSSPCCSRTVRTRRRSTVTPLTAAAQGVQTEASAIVRPCWNAARTPTPENTRMRTAPTAAMGAGKADVVASLMAHKPTPHSMRRRGTRRPLAFARPETPPPFVYCSSVCGIRTR